MTIKSAIKSILARSGVTEFMLGISVRESARRPGALNGLLYRYKGLLPRRSVEITVRFGPSLEARYQLDLSSYVGQEILFNRFEPEVTRFMQEALPRRGVVWDIGANIGYYTVMAGMLAGSEGRVYAFEPVPANFEILSRNVGQNALDNVVLLPFALSDSDGESEIYLLDPDRSTASPTLNKEWAGQSGLDKVCRVQVRNALALVEDGTVEKPDFIKMDAETHEPVIVRNLEPLLRAEDAPDVVIEVMPPTLKPLWELLVVQYGYRCLHIKPEGAYRVDGLEMRRPYNDYFFTKKDALPGTQVS